MIGAVGIYGVIAFVMVRLCSMTEFAEDEEFADRNTSAYVF